MSCTATKWEFYPGEKRKLELRVRSLDKACDCKEAQVIPTGVGTNVTVEVPALPDNLVFTLTSTPPVVIDNADRGEISVDLRPEDTAKMTCGSIIVKLYTAPANYQVASAIGAVSKQTVSNC